MELQLGDVEDLMGSTSVSTQKKLTSEFIPKVCDAKWFLDESVHTDEDDIKFKADYLFLHKDYAQALSTYMTLLQAPRYGSNRSLVAEIYESIAICHKKLQQYNDAKAFCHQAGSAGKSADQLTNNLYVKSRILQASGDEDECLDCMRRLLLLHPYNHFLWLEYSLAQSKPWRELLYLLRTRLLLQINSRNVESFIKSEHSKIISEVDERITVLSQEIGLTAQEKMKEFIKRQVVAERSREDWQSEEYRMGIIGKAAEDIADIFNSRWEFSTESSTK